MTTIAPAALTEPAPARALLDAGWPAPLDLSTLPSGDDPAAAIRHVAAGDFPVLGIPATFGGGDAGMLGLAAAQRQLAIADPGLAIGLCMHSHSVGVMVEHHRRLSDSSWMLLEAIAERHCLVASAFAEPGGSANLMRARTTAVRDGKGWRVSGTKFPCSLCTTAELLCLSARVEGEDTTIVALLPAASDGVTADGEAWPSLGMRSSNTGKLTLDDVYLDDRLIYHRGPAGGMDAIVVMGFVWFAVLMAATYSGVLTAMVESAAAAPGASRRRVALIGEAARHVLALQGACRGLAAQWESGELGGDAGLAAAMALRASASAARDDVARALTPVIGSRLYTAGHAAAGLALDSLAVHHHPPALLVCDEGIGAACVGEPISLDVDR